MSEDRKPGEVNLNIILGSAPESEAVKSPEEKSEEVIVDSTEEKSGEVVKNNPKPKPLIMDEVDAKDLHGLGFFVAKSQGLIKGGDSEKLSKEDQSLFDSIFSHSRQKENVRKEKSRHGWGFFLDKHNMDM
jgi:hypothetical protein